MKYVLVITNTDTPDINVFLIDDYDKACKYLESIWEDAYNYELATGSIINKDETYHEEAYAQIKFGEVGEDWNTVKRFQIVELDELR